MKRFVLFYTPKGVENGIIDESMVPYWRVAMFMYRGGTVTLTACMN